MVTGSRIEGGGTIISVRVRNTIQKIKEIVGNHSESDIYTTLKEADMDPNITADKLLDQEPFHEVRRKRDKKKETTSMRGSPEPRKYAEHVGQGTKFRTYSDYKGPTDTRKNAEHVRQAVKSHTNYDRNAHGGVPTRNALPGRNWEFRVVRDNRVNHNANKESTPAEQQKSVPVNEQQVLNANEKGSSGTSGTQRPSSGRSLPPSNGPADSRSRNSRDANFGGAVKRGSLERQEVPHAASNLQASKPNKSDPESATMSSHNSVLGVYSSSSDPVHVPSPDSRSSAPVGAIKREVGVVGNRRQTSDTSARSSSLPNSSAPNSHLGRDKSAQVERSQPSKSDQLKQGAVTESVMPSIAVSRALLSSQSSNRPHQPLIGHQKASQANKEWKPKTTRKPGSDSPGVIGVSADKCNAVKPDTTQLQDNHLQVNVCEDQNVVIAQHIRVTETDRCQLIFGSFGEEAESKNIAPGFHVVGGEESAEPAGSLSVVAPDSEIDDASGSKKLNVPADNVRHSGSDSAVSAAALDTQLAEKIDSLSPQNMENYADIGLVRDNSPSFTPSDSQQQQDSAELPSFSAYDPQTGYDIPYFRATMNEPVRGQDLSSPQESLSSHTANSIPASTIALVQQQPPQMAQMYPQVHMSHFANLMPYRQYLSPVYVPPMAMPGYSNNPAYPHPSNGSSYLLMPGSNSHLGANGLKYGLQQFKPVPAGSPTGFGSFTNPTGYAINAPGVVGNASGLDDSSRLKYKDGNLYVPNPQAETSEIWVQNPRELPGLQSAAPYYNLPGQTPHAAYMPSHAGHASYNAAAAQSSHMQFPGLYHPPPQPAAIPSPHHLGPAMGGNVGVGVAAASPGGQVGAYQQPQLGHLNWTTNF